MLNNHLHDQTTGTSSNRLQSEDKKRKKKEKEAKKKKQKYEEILNDLDNEVAKKAQEKLVSDIFSQKKDVQFDHSNLELKPDHKLRPVWVCSGTDGKFHIFMETFSPIYQQAYDFLVAVAEPVSRPENLHEYVLTEYSLYAAVSIGMNTEQIIQVLEKLSKVKLSEALINFIRDVTRKYGNVKLVLQKNRFFVESPHLTIMEKLYEDKIISAAAIVPDPNEFPNVDRSKRFIIRTRSKQNELEKFQKQALANTSTVNKGSKIQTEMIRAVNQIGDDEDDDADDDFDISSAVETFYLFEINPTECIEWKNQFKLWSTIDENRVVVFTSQEKDALPKDDDPLIIITTYTMITHTRKRSGEAKEVMDYIQSREWGLLILDEVHVVPANMFRHVASVKSHCKLGLTATLLREDNKTDDLYFLIGPKLYEANWLDLQQKGHLANVQCVEVWCPMTAEFFAEYLTANAKKKTLLYVMNPNKFRACEFLIRYHEKQGDKIIVFSDNVFALQEYAEKLGVPYIFGNTKQQERVYYLNQFRNTNHYNTIFISKVGDTAIDIPEATVIIQISSHFGSRRQEAQRLGRILRPKGGGLKNQQAYFYTLVSQDTQEMFFSTKRQQFLINQGYSFRVLPDIQKYYRQGANEMGLTLKHMNTKKEELDMLAIVKKAEDARGQEEKINVDDEVEKSSSSLASISGGNEIYYHSYEASTTTSRRRGKATKVPSTVHPLFKTRTQHKD
ncbi:predicted protein [Naegleria gruberi]|uniref:Predicted protein n=1 Tax=Naegleria gruberi TaxID=5762 RepID=D2UXM8_NAEGR|nr:uncharacterized protein NAEGRDRAFT_29347 [Naegleria gruberi]EFC50312.1 predicted protein [Naegleria gruberi]|eukprot:XP_002683056.1 predicted protein [Naegleria gruberi strain NEG-M]